MNITIELDLDKFLDEWTWGDLEDLESQSPKKMRQLIQKYAIIEGVEPDEMKDHLRSLTLREMQEVSGEFMKTVQSLSNPVSQNGKNSKRGSRRS